MGIDPVSIGIQLAITAASMALQMTKKIEGPRLENLDVSVGDYNAPLTRVYGKRRVEGCPIIWAEKIRVERQESKTKGGKVSQDVAYGTWAVALAYNEISACPRIWADKHLVLDLTGAGPVTPFAIGSSSPGFKGGSNFAGINFADHITIYKGTEVQEIDPRILAWSEEKFGENSATAYRGMAYAVFKDVPLEKFGNRVPIISAEIITSSADQYPYETLPDAWEYAVNLLFSPDAALLYIGGNMAFDAPFTVIDAAARTTIISGEQPAEIKAIDPWGTLLADGEEILEINPDGGAIVRSSGQLKRPDGVTNTEAIDLFAFDYNDRTFVGIAPISGREDLMYYKPTQPPVVSITTSGWSPQFWCQDTDGDIWAFGSEAGATSTLYFQKVTGGGAAFSISGLPTTGGGLHTHPARHFSDATHDHFLVKWDSELLIIDRATGVLLDTIGYTDDPYVPFKNCRPTDAYWYEFDSGSGVREMSAADGSIVRTIDLTDWGSGKTQIGGIYDAVNHAWVGLNSDGSITWYYLDRVDGEGIALSAIAEDVSERVGITDHDFSDQDDIIVPGWTTAGIGQASNQIEPLFDAYDCDIHLHDFTVKGTKRHGVSGGTLYTERFVAGENRYSIRLRQSRELPIAISVNFADTNADQQPNNVRCPLPIVAKDAQGEKQLDLGTWAGTPDAARALGDRYMRRMWNERREVSLSLTAQELALEPGDVRTLDLDGEQWTARLVKLTIQADGVLATEWKYDDPHLANLGGLVGAEMDGRPATSIVVPLISKGFILDIPLVTDSDNSVNPLVYVAAAPYASGAWPGAVIYELADGEIDEEAAAVSSSASVTWGYATDVLPETNPWLWDRGSSVNVSLQNGSLTGTTEAAIDANPRTNMALLGNEIVNFTTATLEGDGTYTLSGFKRGRRGTEWACGDHAARDVFLLLDTVDDVEQGLSEVGTDLSFKAVTNGRTAAGAFPIPVPFTGASLKPYAPCHLEAVKESNGNWTLSWVRRTRVGGAWTSGTSIPLGEASEEYEVTVGDGVDDSTATVTSPTYTWTLAAQTTLTGGEVLAGDLVFSVAQVSDAVGAGFLAEATA